MLRRDVTWGDLRAIHEDAVRAGVSSPEDILSDPEIMEESKKKRDDEYYYDITDEEAQEFKDIDAENDIDAQPGTVSVTISRTGEVLELIKVLDNDGGDLYVREQETWALVYPDQDEPRIFDQTLANVESKFVEYWDRLKDRNVKVTKETIQNYLV